MRFTLLLSLFGLLAIGQVNAQQDSTQSFEPFQPAKPVERMPSFPGGIEAMYKFVYSEMRYPAEARKFGISGQVITQFVVNADGKIGDIEVTKSLGYGCDEEAIRIITVMQKKYTWNPGLHNDKAVPVKFTLPLKFHLG
jgi:periplasmic protein TonB